MKLYKLFLSAILVLASARVMAAVPQTDRKAFSETMNAELAQVDKSIGLLEERVTRESDRTNPLLPDRISKLKKLRHEFSQRIKAAESADAGEFASNKSSAESLRQKIAFELTAVQ